MIKSLLSCFLILICVTSYSQKQIKIHFLYGSVPSKQHRDTEKKRFGGKKGGHVTIQLADSIIGFQPGGNCHVVAYSKPNGYFKVENEKQWAKDSVGNKYTSIIIPVTDSQYNLLSYKLRSYLANTPYDYAVFGMRCAAATYDILEDISLVSEKSKTGKWSSFFYPQLLRRHLLRIAKERNYEVVRHEGVRSRVWEKE